MVPRGGRGLYVLFRAAASGRYEVVYVGMAGGPDVFRHDPAAMAENRQRGFRKMKRVDFSTWGNNQ